MISNSNDFCASPLPKRQRALCSALTALLWWAACWQSGLFALGWVALLPYFYSLQGLKRRERWRQGYAAGWLCYAVLNWWIIPTVARASPVIGVPSIGGFFLGLLAVSLIAAIHGTFLGLVALLWQPAAPCFQRYRLLLPLAVALLWALLDAARCETVFAHGWGALAYTQWRDVALLQSAALLGQHGLTALCVWFAASLALWAQTAHLKKASTLWLLPVATFALLHLAGAWRLMRRAPAARSLRTLIVQTNASSLGKNFSMGGEGALDQAIRLTQAAAAGKKFDIVVWPETTVFAGRLSPPGRRQASSEAAVSPGLPVGASLELEQVAHLSRALGTPILCGANATQSRLGAQPGGLRNTAMLVDPSGRVQWSAKSRLVPFGEKAPLGDQIPFLKNLAPQPEVLAASEPQVLSLRLASGESIRIGAVICFESCFPAPATVMTQHGAKALFILTNDEWFSGTDAPGEHAAMCALRAVENHLPVAQAANGGYAAAVDEAGRFIVLGQYGVKGTIDARLPIRP